MNATNATKNGDCAMRTGEVNGVDLNRLFETGEAFRRTPGLAAFKFRVNNEWINSGHNRSTIKTFYGAGREQDSRSEPFIIESDGPPVLLGTDRGANPLEYLLHALAACVTTSLVYHAAARGIRIEEVISTVEGDLDIRGFFGLDGEIPRGYKDIRIRFKIKADVPDERLEELLQLGPAFSPVFDTITRPVNVEVSLDK